MTANVTRRDMRDPMLVVQERQEAAIRRSCVGCRFIRLIPGLDGKPCAMCLKQQRVGRRCMNYEVTNAG